MKYIFLFPGQGAQSVGMGKELYQTFPTARRIFDKADSTLKTPLTKLIFEGPIETLTATENAQPALFTVEAAIVEVLAEKGIFPSLVLGHSLGEYSALYAAGVFSFEHGLATVARRGELMASAGREAPGTMAAVLGLSKDKIKEVLSLIKEGTVVCANENSPDQTVISGSINAVKTATQELLSAGAKRVVPLQVSGAFHSPLMATTADKISTFLESIPFSNPRCPVISNVSAQPESDSQHLKQLLIKQMVSPVRWVDSLQHLVGRSEETLLETGPGNVLKGLVKKSIPEREVIPCGSVENIYSLTQKKSTGGIHD